MRWVIACFPLLLAVTAVGVCSSAHAQDLSDDDLGRSHFLAGQAYFQQGRYEEAAEQFSESFELSHRPALLINIATSYERALMFGEAIATLEHYLRDFPDTERTAQVTQKIAALRELQARHEGASTTEPAEASDSDGPPPASAVGDSPPPSSAGASSEPGALLWAGVGLAGLGLVAGGVSLATGLMAHDTYERLQTSCPGGFCSSDNYAQVADGALLADVSTALFLVGAIAGAAGLVLISLDLAGIGREGGSVDVSVSPTGLTARGSF